MMQNDYRVLSLTQPWASLVADGWKRIETRSWQTSWRGRLLIHATARPDQEFSRKWWVEGFVEKDLPLGAIVAVCDLVDISPTEDLRYNIDDFEHQFGDYGFNRFGWHLRNVTALATPVPCKGAQGLWKPSADLVAAVSRELAK